MLLLVVLPAEETESARKYAASLRAQRPVLDGDDVAFVVTRNRVAGVSGCAVVIADQWGEVAFGVDMMIQPASRRLVSWRSGWTFCGTDVLNVKGKRAEARIPLRPPHIRRFSRAAVNLSIAHVLSHLRQRQSVRTVICRASVSTLRLLQNGHMVGRRTFSLNSGSFMEVFHSSRRARYTAPARR